MAPFVGNETKVKIPSEIKPPLDAITAWPHNGHLLFYSFHASALHIYYVLCRSTSIWCNFLKQSTWERWILFCSSSHEKRMHVSLQTFIEALTFGVQSCVLEIFPPYPFILLLRLGLFSPTHLFKPTRLLET